MPDFSITDFALERIFDPERAGTTIVGMSPNEFESFVNNTEPLIVHDGYADFCKLFVFENTTPTLAGTVELTPETRPFLRSEYKARNDEELPVLTRWVEGMNPPRATHLVAIAYSQEQMRKEGSEIETDWGIVAVLAQTHPNEEPMPPITMMRNALGVDEGGSGVPLDRDAYMRAVDFWEHHATVKVV